MTLLDPQSEWSRLLLGSFVACGVRELVCSPGSRSTPFLLAALELEAQGRLRVTSIVDERAAAFFALGQARVSARPSLLLCTSGSAPAHYFPALVEARAARVPMLVLSADRPLEAQAAGAHQTIDQVKLFGDAALGFFELGSVDAEDAALRGVRRIVAQAVALAARGPVHLNARARKPLEPRPCTPAELADSERIRAAAAIAPPLMAPPALIAHEGELRRLAVRIAEEREGVLVVGPATPADAALLAPLVALASRAGYPILAEPTSQLGAEGVLLGGLALLASPAARARLRPRLVIQVGATPVSAGYLALLGEGPRLEILARDLEVDAESRAAAVVVGDPASSCAWLAARLEGLSRDDAYAQRWRLAARLLATRLAPASREPRAELACVRALLDALPGPTQLVVGNSLPVRELDLACAVAGTVPRVVLHQRGASGIDGLVAGASGAASIGGETVLLLGDVSLLHDLHGLALAGERTETLLVVAIDNGGGRIFDTLPIGKRADLASAQPLFTTPRAHDLAALARFAGAAYARAEDARSIATLVSEARTRGGATLLHVVVDPTSAARAFADLPAHAEAAVPA